MKNPRKYGLAPYNVVVLHGGPGAPGEVAPLAKVLSSRFGVLEPLQTKDSVEGQVEELHQLISQNGNLPVCLVGHSWGAWLALIYAAKYPSCVGKLILVSAAAFEEHYNAGMMTKRLVRLSGSEQKEVNRSLRIMNFLDKRRRNELFKRFGELMTKADTYDSLETFESLEEFQFDLFQKVWREAEELRRNGELLREGAKIQCPVIAIHGDFDTHPAKGVEEPLSKIVKDFTFYKLKKCGHYPWNERLARDQFFEILEQVLGEYVTQRTAKGIRN